MVKVYRRVSPLQSCHVEALSTARKPYVSENGICVTIGETAHGRSHGNLQQVSEPEPSSSTPKDLRVCCMPMGDASCRLKSVFAITCLESVAFHQQDRF